MDPNVTLERIRNILSTPYQDSDGDDLFSELCDLIEALDTWLSAGGFLPIAWERKR